MPIAETTLHSWLLTAVEAAATLAFALSGVLEAARKKLDVVGTCVVAVVWYAVFYRATHDEWVQASNDLGAVRTELATATKDRDRAVAHAQELASDEASLAAARAEPKLRASAGFINAVLRRFLRERDALLAGLQANLVARYNDQGEVTVDSVFLQLMRERYREYTSQAS